MRSHSARFQRQFNVNISTSVQRQRKLSTSVQRQFNVNVNFQRHPLHPPHIPRGSLFAPLTPFTTSTIACDNFYLGTDGFSVQENYRVFWHRATARTAVWHSIVAVEREGIHCEALPRTPSRRGDIIILHRRGENALRINQSMCHKSCQFWCQFCGDNCYICVVCLSRLAAVVH
jgi:hypothetical protein